jgi:hypothetical protein
MTKIQIILYACAAVILFMTLTYFLIGLLSKMYQSSRAKYSKTQADLEKDKSFKL